MASFIHAADLHLGLRLTRFGEAAAGRIQEARVQALENVLAAAGSRGADFIVIAGDLFDDPFVDATTARRAFHILEAGPCPVYVLPGNHDPLLPGSVWEREPWSRTETQKVRVLRAAEPVSHCDPTVLYPCPVLRKTSLDDPTAWIPAPSPAERATTIRIGIAHGSVRDRETLPPDDHPIGLTAADDHGLDYLALGHWHAFRQYGGGDGAVRTAYSGVHEPMGFPAAPDVETGWVPYASAPDRPEFCDDGRGRALSVAIDAPRAAPRVEAVQVGVLTWVAQSQTVHSEADLAAIIGRAAERADPDRTILRLRLEGVLDAAAMGRLAELREVLEKRYLHGELDDRGLHLEPSAEEVRELVGRGVLRAVFERLEEETALPAPAQEEELTRQRSVAERAVMLLYRIASEVTR